MRESLKLCTLSLNYLALPVYATYVDAESVMLATSFSLLLVNENSQNLITAFVEHFFSSMIEAQLLKLNLTKF
jgi:hypothetical protein